MSAYLLDTNHVSAIYRGQLILRSHAKLRTDDTFGIAVSSVGELWFMIFNSVRVNENTAALNAVLAQLPVYQFTESAAMEFGRIKAELRKAGRPIPDVDVQIAAVARASDLTLITDDSHFQSVPNLRTDNWLR